MDFDKSLVFVALLVCGMAFLLLMLILFGV